jgi:AbrB family looped-hinge helix DNA binding protein
MRITSKGQVTIPAEIRERAGFVPNTEVEFVMEGDTVKLVRARSVKRESRGQRAVRLLRGRATVKMSTDDIMKLTRS